MMKVPARLRGVIRPLAIASGLLLLFAVTRFFPNEGGAAPGTPNGVLLMGAIAGGLTAMTAVGIVLVYRTTRIINFAQAALGGIGAVFAYNFFTVWGLPYGAGLALAVLISALFGVVSDLILQRFFKAPRLVLTVATLGLMSFYTSQAVGVSFLPIWGDDNRTALARGFGELIKPVDSFGFTVTPFRFEFAHLLAMILVPAALVAVGLFLRKTKLGVAVRATSENTERAEMLGINVRMLSTTVWTIAGALAGLGVTLKSTTETFATAVNSDFVVLLPALAAAVLAGMRYLPTAAIAAIGISVLERALTWSFPDQSRAILAVVLLTIVVVGPLLMLAQRRVRDREVSSWEAIEETRPIPEQLANVPEIRMWRNILIGLAVGGVLLFPWISSVGPTNLAGVAAVSGIVLLAIIVLTGWTGQVSLGHWGLLGVGALIGGALTAKAGLSFWIALPVGAIGTGLIAGLIGLPALRIRGLMLAVTTFAFAFFVSAVLFNESWFGWLHPEAVDRPTLLLLDFEDERSMYYLSVGALVLCFLLVASVRRSRPGRVLLALRENEEELASIGINPTRMRLAAFVFSGFLVGIAGVVFAHHQRAVTDGSFAPIESLTIFLFAVIGGLGAPAGALLGAGVRMLQETLGTSDPFLALFLNPALGVILILYVAPRGLWGLVQSARDSVLRVVAQRRGILAPSLFADMDAAAIEKRLVLMTEPQETRGLAALPENRRYRMDSVMYARAGAVESEASEERKTLAAAAEKMFERALSEPVETDPEPVPATTTEEDG